MRLHGTCREQRQLDVVAAVERQVHDLLVVDHLALGRFRSYQQRRIGGDGNGFGHNADFQDQIDLCGLLDLKDDSVAEHPPESGLLGRYAIGADT